MTKGNNKYGAAGRRGVPGKTAAAFFDAYTYEDEYGKVLNCEAIPPNRGRTLRRWRNTEAQTSENALAGMLLYFGFDRAWFEKWCKLHRKPLRNS